MFALKLLNDIWGFSGSCLLFPASFKLVKISGLLMLHPLPCLTTFNNVGYINESELNNLNVVFRQYATHCILSYT